MENKQANKTKQNQFNYKQGLQLNCISEELAQGHQWTFMHRLSKVPEIHPAISFSSKTMIPPAKPYGRNSARAHRRFPQNFIISECSVQFVLDFLHFHCVLKEFCREALTWLFSRM